ncbi:MAG: formyltransferase family protein [Pseudomonadota bacterium]
MALKRFHDPGSGAMRVAGFMSGSGTNLRRILEHQGSSKKREGASPYEVVVIFSDSAASSAPAIGKDFDIPVITRDLRAYCKARGRPRRDMAVREEFDLETLKALKPYGVSFAAYAGYMSVASRALINGFPGINVHPADLGIKEGGGRKYRGDHAVADAIRAGEKTICSTTHIVEEAVDEGRILMISDGLSVEIGEGLAIGKDIEKIESVNQDRLKKAGDWVIFPATLRLIAEGRFSYDEASGLVHFDGKPAPDGIRPGDAEEKPG